MFCLIFALKSLERLKNLLAPSSDRGVRALVFNLLNLKIRNEPNCFHSDSFRLINPTLSQTSLILPFLALRHFQNLRPDLILS